MSTAELPVDYEANTKPDLGQHAVLLAAVSLIALVGNTVATDATVIQGLVGLAVLYVIAMVGLVLTHVVPINLPSVAWISLVGILATLPWTPGSAWVLDKVSHVNFLTLATPCLFLPFFLKNATHIYLPSPFLRQSQCTHLRIPRPPLLGGAVPRCPRSLVQTSTPVPFQCRFLRRAPVTPPRAAGAWSRIFRS